MLCLSIFTNSCHHCFSLSRPKFTEENVFEFSSRFRSRSTLSSVHFIGINDPLKGKSESYLTNTFNDNIAYPVYLNGGHGISAFSSKVRATSQ